MRKGEANMSRKASGTEKKKLSKRDEYMAEIEQADAAEVMDDDTLAVVNQLVADEIGDEETTIESLALEYAACTAQESEAARRKDEIKPILKKVLPLAGLERAVTDLVAVEIVDGTSPRSLDPKKLLAEGVNLEVINRCYSGGAKYKYAIVRLRKPKD